MQEMMGWQWHQLNHCNLFCCSTETMSSIPSWSWNSIFYLNVAHPVWQNETVSTLTALIQPGKITNQAQGLCGSTNSNRKAHK